MRQFWVGVHRYLGLSMAVFLVIAGLSGSALVFYDELDATLNPGLYHISPPSPEARPLDPLIIRERLLKKYPRIHINWITLQLREEHALSIKVSPKNAADDPGFDEIFVNPYTGDVLGTRTWGKITDGIKNLAPFLFRLHYQLALDRFGSLLLGVVALLWTIDCFIGTYLTLPGKARRRAGNLVSSSKQYLDAASNWFGRWRSAWKIRWRGGRYKLNFDLHRAGGLWLWAMLFVLAWSSVALNLPVVYRPVMGLALDFQDVRDAFPRLDQPNTTPRLSYAEARAAALDYLDSPRAIRDDGPITQLEPAGMSYYPQVGSYHYRFRSNRDVHSDWGHTRMYIDGTSGEILALYLPTGETAGDTLTNWLRTLHMAGVWGLPFRIFVSISGVLVAMLSITGLVIWWRKRSARRRTIGALSTTKNRIPNY